MPVSEVTSADVLEILTPIWHAKPPTARIVRHRIRAVLEFAIAMGWSTDNPCDRLLPVLGSQHHVVRHRKALPHREVGAAIRKVRGGEGGQGGASRMKTARAHRGLLCGRALEDSRRGPEAGRRREIEPRRTQVGRPQSKGYTSYCTLLGG